MNLIDAYLMIAFLLGTTAIYEGWALATKNPTISRGVWNSPRWFKAIVIGGLCCLIVHFAFQWSWPALVVWLASGLFVYFW